MPTYSELNTLNPSINPQRRNELEALYEGGEKIERLYPQILKRRQREREARHAERLERAQYRNYIGPIIDYFKSMLFVSRPVLKAKAEGAEEATTDPGEYWTDLREDCDRGGTDLDALFGHVLTDAMVTRTGWIRLHQPDGETPGDRALFEQLGLGEVWLERLECCQVLDWDIAEDGRLAWAIVHSISTPRLSIAGGRNTVVETWDFLTREAVETYRITYERGKPPKPDEAVSAVGAPVPHRFGAVPLVCLDLPPALWVANRLRSPQVAHLRKLSDHAWSLSCTAIAMPVIKVKNVEEFNKSVSGNGYEIVIGPDEDYTWASPPTAHFAALDTEIKAEKDEIFRIANQMALGVENNAAAVGRSAESKASDAENTRVVLVAFSRQVKECIEYTLDLISNSRGDKLEWSVEGLDDFAAFDVGAFLEQLKLVSESGGIPSRTFEVQSKTRVAEALLPDVDEATKTAIREEIEDGAVDPVEQRERETAAALAVFADPSGTKRPGADSEKPKAPAGGGGGRTPPRKKPSVEKPAP